MQCIQRQGELLLWLRPPGELGIELPALGVEAVEHAGAAFKLAALR